MPHPLNLDAIPLAYRVDDDWKMHHDYWMDKSPIELEIFTRSQDVESRVVEEFHWIDGPCYIPRQMNNDKPILREHILRINSLIAIEMGITPAAFHVFLPQHDSEFTKTYRWHFTVECRHGIKTCIRPSHLKIRLQVEHPIRFPLVRGRLDHHSAGYREPKDPSIFTPSRSDLSKVLDGVRRAKQKRKSAQDRIDKGKPYLNDHDVVFCMNDYLQLYAEYKANPNEVDFNRLLKDWELKMIESPPPPRRLWRYR